MKKWLYDKCQKEALKYKTRGKFAKKSGGAYNEALKNGWLDEICQHMVLKHKPNGYWSKDRCREVALNYTNKSEYVKNFPSSYTIARKNGWLNEICSHMIKMGNRHNKCIYVYEFFDNHAYIGLTYNIAERQRQRNNDVHDAVTIHIKETGLKPTIKKLTEYVLIDEAIKLEGYYYNKYKENGWIMLNRAKTGAIGGKITKWTKNKCIEVAMLCENKTDFRKKYDSAYTSSFKNGWLPDISLIFISRRRNVCEKNANACKTKKEFKYLYNDDYKYAYRYGFFNDICKHMVHGNIKTKNNVAVSKNNIIFATK